MSDKVKTPKQAVDNSEFLARLPQTHTRPLEERVEAGKQLREICSRKAQATWEPPEGRLDPVDLLIENSQGRMESLIPIRYGRMAADPFAFYRGAAAIMAYDLSHTPSTGLKIQICGDCHLLNFGGFATTERKLAFDINDFDETSIAPWEWDVKRLAASFVVAGRTNGFKEKHNRKAARRAAQSYREAISKYATMPLLQAWYDAMDLEQIIADMPKEWHRDFYMKKIKGAKTRSDHEKEFAKLTYQAGDNPRIVDQPPLIYHYEDDRDVSFLTEARESMARYFASLSPDRQVLMNRYTLVDSAVRVVGVGSVGTVCAIGLFLSGNGDPLFIQVKQARQSVLEPYAGASVFAHAGQRVVVGQRLMQASGDMFLGWYTGAGYQNREYYARQLRDVKIKPVVEMMDTTNLIAYAGLCGQALARAHARSGDAAVLMGYMGDKDVFEEALADFSLAYADQNERDHTALLDAIGSGRIEARMGE